MDRKELVEILKGLENDEELLIDQEEITIMKREENENGN